MGGVWPSCCRVGADGASCPAATPLQFELAMIMLIASRVTMVDGLARVGQVAVAFMAVHVGHRASMATILAPVAIFGLIFVAKVAVASSALQGYFRCPAWHRRSKRRGEPVWHTGMAATPLASGQSEPCNSDGTFQPGSTRVMSGRRWAMPLWQSMQVF